MKLQESQNMIVLEHGLDFDSVQICLLKSSSKPYGQVGASVSIVCFLKGDGKSEMI